MEVKIKDRSNEVEFLRMALNMCELGIDYTQADLIIRVTKSLNKLKGKFSINDGVEIHHKWKEEWQKYFENQIKSSEIIE